jgi:hypothetical protein
MIAIITVQQNKKEDNLQESIIEIVQIISGGDNWNISFGYFDIFIKGTTKRC